MTICGLFIFTVASPPLSLELSSQSLEYFKEVGNSLYPVISFDIFRYASVSLGVIVIVKGL